MSTEQFTHIDDAGNPRMVDVSEKKVTTRTAKAQALVQVGPEILQHLQGDELITKKGPVFQTAIIAGVMGAKQTASLIPFCHPLGLEDCQVHIAVKNNKIVIDSVVTITAKTGVEMEALTAVTVAALTVYDMCKALSHNMVIEEIKLMAKTGGKKDFQR
jgi:cyclic pyranopterin phosphate synthase